MSEYKTYYHHYHSGEFGSENELFVACEHNDSNGFVTVCGIEHNEKDGYAFFEFDDFAGNLNPEDRVEFMAYLGNSTAKGFSSAWYEKVSEILDEYYDDKLLQYLTGCMFADAVQGVELTCASCNHIYKGKVFHDELGWHGVCPKCGASFPVDAIDVDAASENAIVEVEAMPDGTVECSLCRESLECNDCGDMPDVCPRCGSHLGYSAFEPSDDQEKPAGSGESADKTTENSERGKDVYYVTYRIDARYIAEVKADSVEDALEKAKHAFWDADFGAAEDIDGEPVIVEDAHGDFVWDKP